MPPPQRLFHGDEDLAKKDDDHKPGASRSMLWRQRTIPHVQRRLAKRVAVGVVTLIAFYFFFKNMPTVRYDLSPAMTYVLLEVVSYDKQKLIEKSHRI